MFRFGVDSLIWTEDFTVKDLSLIEKVKAAGQGIYVNIKLIASYKLPISVQDFDKAK